MESLRNLILKNLISLIKLRALCLYVVLIPTIMVLHGQKVYAERSLPELVTDRPDQTESSIVVLPGIIQVETGILYTEEDEASPHSRKLALPGTLFRIGLFDRVELRLGFDGFIAEDGTDEEDGIGDSEVGVKVFFTEEKGLRPEMAFLASLSLPTGENAFSSERKDPSFRFLFSHSLTEHLALGTNLGMAWGTKANESGVGLNTLSTFQYTISLGMGLTDKVGSYLEFFGDMPMSDKGNPAHSFNGGVTYLLKDQLQFDVSSGFGLSQSAEDWFVGTGVSFAFPFLK